MCTLSFIPNVDGLILGMNRDEQKSRVKALPPKIRQLNEKISCLGPSEPNGVMWIAAGQNGNVFALLNWYSVSTQKIGHHLSRGLVIPSLIHHDSISSFKSALEHLTQNAYNPFRLVTFFTRLKTCIEWRYNGNEITFIEHFWASTLWASSGHNEPEAQHSRKAVWDGMIQQNNSETVASLRTFHQSHLPEKGALSVCMHREDAHTVSYTEIEIGNAECRMQYVVGPPCRHGERTAIKIPIQ